MIKDDLNQKINDIFSYLDSELVSQILKVSILKTYKSNSELLREGQYIKVIPLVIRGLIKVYTRYDDRELLLYYIQPKESCIMSFSACLNNNPSQVFAVTEEESTILLLPVNKVSALAKQFPDFNTLFFQQYNQRYGELLNTIHHVLFDKMDKRLYNHLMKKVKIINQNPIKISHQQLANELGTVREVISRVLKKLESEGLVKQDSKGIELIQM